MAYFRPAEMAEVCIRYQRTSKVLQKRISITTTNAVAPWCAETRTRLGREEATHRGALHEEENVQRDGSRKAG